MRVATWNIRHGGFHREKAIADELGQMSADVVVLTEYRAGNDALTTALNDLGYTAKHAGTEALGENSVLIAARETCERLPITDLSVECEQRAVGVQIAELNIIGMYFPQLQKKRPLFAWLEQATPALLGTATLLIGDLNTGKHGLDEAGRTFVAADAFEKLEHIGWKDLWRGRHGDRREYSWYHRPDNGFRLDHALGTPPLLSRVLDARYLHGVRERSVSDHSALIVDIRDA